MTDSMWASIREYIAAEIKLAHSRLVREEIERAEYCDYRAAKVEAVSKTIAGLEEQSTLMDTEIRRLISASDSTTRP